jgi:hypothetical protein
MATLFLCDRQRVPRITNEGTRTVGNLEILNAESAGRTARKHIRNVRTSQRWSTRDMPLTIPRLLTSHPIGCCNAQLPAFATLVHDGMKRRQSQDHYGMPNNECHVLQRNMRITPYNNASRKMAPANVVGDGAPLVIKSYNLTLVQAKMHWVRNRWKYTSLEQTWRACV